jgi:hypothetical protein
MFGADLRTPFHYQRGGQPLLTEAPKRRPGPITASRRVELLVRVVPVAPAVGESLPEPGARDLTPKLGLKAASGIASAAAHRVFEVAQFGLHVCLERAGESGNQFHGRPVSCERVMLVAEPDLMGAPSQLPACQSSQPSPEAPVPRCGEEAFAR